MKRTVMAWVLMSSVLGCQPAPTQSVQRSDTTASDAAPANADTTADGKSTGPIHLPSQSKPQSTGYKMPATKPNEVCMQKGFTYLYQGYLKPECGTCHYKDNRYNVTAFAQGEDEAASFTVLRTVTDKAKLLSAVLGNVFCKNCVISKEDPLYADLEYFTTHMETCDKPN